MSEQSSVNLEGVMKTADTPSTATVVAQLQEALAALLTAEHAVLDATLELAALRIDLQREEDGVLLADPPLLDGKNETIRAAQLRALTFGYRHDVEIAEDARLRAGSALEGARATFAAAKALARLLAGTGE